MAYEAGAVPPRRGPLAVLPGGASTGPLPVPVLDSGTGTSTAAALAARSGPSAVPVPASTVQPMTVPERAAAAARYRYRNTVLVASEACQPFARLFHALANPKTMAEHRTHIKTRAWVPPEMTGKKATAIAWAGVAYHVCVARPVKAFSKSLDSTADYPLAFFPYMAFLAVLVLILFIVL